MIKSPQIELDKMFAVNCILDIHKICSANVMLTNWLDFGFPQNIHQVILINLTPCLLNAKSMNL